VIVSVVSLGVGLIVGYLGQRSRMCSIGGLRDYVLVRDTALLKGAGALLLGAWLSFGVLRFFGGSAANGRSGLIANGTAPSHVTAYVAILGGAILLGFFATLSGACPLRQHVLAGQGRIGAWWFLAGFYLMAIVYTSWVQPSIGGWVI
jgi:uncharacterized membrane protein YedE/YeeE